MIKRSALAPRVYGTIIGITLIGAAAQIDQKSTRYRQKQANQCYKDYKNPMRDFVDLHVLSTVVFEILRREYGASCNFLKPEQIAIRIVTEYHSSAIHGRFTADNCSASIG